jgi:hypothetical protein
MIETAVKPLNFFTLAEIPEKAEIFSMREQSLLCFACTREAAHKLPPYGHAAS